MNNMPPKSVYQQGQNPNMLGEAYRPMGKTDFQFKDFLNDESKVEEVKSFISAFNYNYLSIFLIIYIILIGRKFRCKCCCTWKLDN